MVNRIDFHQSEHTDPAVCAGTVAVLVDGTLCTELEPLEIVRASWPEFGWARLAYNPAAQTDTGSLSVEQVEAQFETGRDIVLEQVYSRVPGGATSSGLILFAGQIDTIKTDLDERTQQVEFVARDFSATASRVLVHGQWTGDDLGQARFLGGLDTIFNPNGLANAHTDPIEQNGATYTVFCPEPSQARFWTCAQVLEYLLSVYVSTGRLSTPTSEQLRALTEDRLVRDLDVTGLDLLTALQRCCERIGLRFKFVPRMAGSGPRQSIVFYKDANARTVELNCQHRNERLSLGRTDVWSLRKHRAFSPVTHRTIGHGDFKVFESTFDLVKAWDSGLEDTDYDLFSPSTNPAFHQVRDVYRKWCLNEAGDYTDAPYNRGPTCDLSGVFDCEYVAARRRRFWPALTGGSQGKSLGYYLQVSFDGGANWWQYLYAFNNLLDECGIWLSSDQLDVDTWVAALKGQLEFRITASVVGDERLQCIVADGAVGSAAPVVDHLVTLPRQFKYRKVTAGSTFFKSTDETIGPADEADDTAALYEFVRQRAAQYTQVVETIDVTTPILGLHYQIGDTVASGPESRDLLSGGSDLRTVRRIERVRVDFRKQCTDLKVIARRTWNG